MHHLSHPLRQSLNRASPVSSPRAERTFATFEMGDEWARDRVQPPAFGSARKTLEARKGMCVAHPVRSLRCLHLHLGRDGVGIVKGGDPDLQHAHLIELPVREEQAGAAVAAK